VAEHLTHKPKIEGSNPAGKGKEPLALVERKGQKNLVTIADNQK
jgi:hypothetical protein